ncbi:MAG: hypothetical protein HN817_01590 [Porticoccaceae bacterium]|jgi:hypothetical protein|nr:hypothetical protein [Porticoccaceae bacterium]MBT7374605.1 hypothetical protein [Porticoccaceae bacterium]
MSLQDRLFKRFGSQLREKAIKRAQTRIVLVGRTAADLSPEELEIVVEEEESKLKEELRDKGVLLLFALLGISWLG